MKPITLTIGIPAFNEEKNIARLLRLLVKQKIKNVQIEKIVVVSDRSTDNTISEIKKVRDERIQLVENVIRVGVAQIKNKIMKDTASDFIIFLDADVIPQSSDFIQKLIDTANSDNHIGIVGAAIKSLPPQTFTEKIIADSHELKNKIYTKINKGSNLYLCHGRALCLSKKFYSKLTLKNEYPEDSFMYLMCLKRKFKFLFCSDAIVLFRSPAIFSDHMLQSTRFLIGKKNLKKHFSTSIAHDIYDIPFHVSFPVVLRTIFDHPLSLILYILIFSYMKVYSFSQNTYTVKWRIATTSKNITL